MRILRLSLVIAFLVVIPASGSDFPKDFRWCVATSAHQIEGNNISSDWWAWEQIPGTIKNGDSSGLATDHWNRVGEDIELMTQLHLKTYRLSIEWAKIEPVEGQFDSAVIRHYRNEIRALQKAGIEPMITLHHFTFPQWVREKGGWEWKDIDRAFGRFTELVFKRIGSKVRWWVTVNEPLVNIGGGYFAGVIPPGEKRKIEGLFEPIHGMLRAHAQAYRTLHRLAAKRHWAVFVGFAHHLRTMDPWKRYNPLDHWAAATADQVWNWMIPEAAWTGHLNFKVIGMVDRQVKIPELAGTQDFFGLNYYTGDLMELSFSKGVVQHSRPGLEKNDLGWDIYPDGMFRILKTISKKYPSIPIFITENGIADASDSKRPKFILEHLAAVKLAMQDGARVLGYCHWSLLDNFEWLEGFSPRFGLYEVDYRTMNRYPRRSAEVFSRIAETNSLTTYSSTGSN